MNYLAREMLATRSVKELILFSEKWARGGSIVLS